MYPIIGNVIKNKKQSYLPKHTKQLHLFQLSAKNLSLILLKYLKSLQNYSFSKLKNPNILGSILLHLIKNMWSTGYEFYNICLIF